MSAAITQENNSQTGGLDIDPMHQFEITPLLPLPHIGGVDVSFTNASLFMLIAVGLVMGLMLWAASQRALVPGRLQMLGELAYNFVGAMVRDNIGRDGQAFFPFVFTLFMFILFSNMLGMIPYAFTVTSHLIVTFALASVVFLLVTGVGLVKHGMKFFTLFVPKGIPVVLLPLLVVIELISYLSRPISLSVRLFANMLAGHTMLKVFGAFVVGLGQAGWWPLALAPFAFMVAFTGLEILIAFLQAYVFAILTCIYLNDAIHLSH